MFNYFNYHLPHQSLEKLIETNKYKKVVFFIDMSSIARGLFNRKLLEYEFDLLRNKSKLSLMITNLNDFLKETYETYKKLEPSFCIFYDYGGSVQNKIVSSDYKANRKDKAFLKTEEEKELYQQLRLYYFKVIQNKFNIDKVSKVVCLNEYESDFVPYYFIKKYEFNQQPDVLNIVISIDKDLLQCCQLNNTYQAINTFLRSENRHNSVLYNDTNALSYIYKNFNYSQYPGITSKYIPLVLALASDTADGIKGVKYGFGVASAIKLIYNYKIPHDFDVNYPLPIDLGGCQDQLQQNLNMTSFERQIERVPDHILNIL